MRSARRELAQIAEQTKKTGRSPHNRRVKERNLVVMGVPSMSELDDRITVQ